MSGDNAILGSPYDSEAGFYAGAAYVVGVRPRLSCTSDTDASGEVDVDYLIAVILAWGTEGTGHNGDIDSSGLVDVDDLIGIVIAWGRCP